MPRAVGARADGPPGALPPAPPPVVLPDPPAWFGGQAIALAAVIAVLSWWPVRNMASRHQAMNLSFNRLHLVNTYGAFGTISRERHEVVIEGTDDPAITSATEWREYGFKGKPGDPRRRSP